MHTFLYILLAILGLNLLVFIHELGHYIVARRNGMKVEVFSIGFGKPLFSWTRKGVKWQVCPLFFGGYVRIAGMEKEGDLEPYEVPDGFYSKKPWARIKVALAGPIVNLVFALLLFTAIWGLGGRQKPFSQFTQLIGYIDPHSELYQSGIRPGDAITEYNHETFEGYKDLIYAALVNGHPTTVEGEKINYFTQEKTPYDYTVTPYENPFQKGMKTIGVLAPASYLIYEAPIYQNLPLATSGIEAHDRIVWVNGELIFSNEQLSKVLNSGKTLLTIEREGKILLGKVPRIPLDDLRMASAEADEIGDWKYAAGLRQKGESYLFIPYTLSSDLHVEKGLYYINEDSQVARASSSIKTSSLDLMLRPGDRIVAVDGVPVSHAVNFLKELQTPRAQIIVKRAPPKGGALWKTEDEAFLADTNWEGLLPIAKTIGSSQPLTQSGNFHLLKPVTPIRLKDFPLSPKEKEQLQEAIQARQADIEKISDAEAREQAYAALNDSQNRLILGISLTDRFVTYNPNPVALFGNVFGEIARNLTALFTGSLGPKQFGGPIFIVQVMQQSWGLGIKEALFWLGAISLNLGVLNLLPIPVLDGGHICFSLIEKIRKKPLKAKTMQRMILPFVALLIFVFIYLTYNDLTRIFGRFF
ncbi:site-2 protease family protein [Candidatus Neptunochlamydia vexilliferae]|uniref:Zinc metalloprotease n=1 Tax=Candidatus Neptunichlamydia vexilliferae TaxID=1651774 RepID=A0ABS0AXQ7_9BACT|nr:site-2 protease family protein [Candidatus Neptunochlamydia vexilliferae]MBF5058924.1 putative zinc metalloprotease [Candidatus Neptunochlamydia vexilliferae]